MTETLNIFVLVRTHFADGPYISPWRYGENIIHKAIHPGKLKIYIL